MNYYFQINREIVEFSEANRINSFEFKCYNRFAAYNRSLLRKTRNKE